MPWRKAACACAEVIAGPRRASAVLLTSPIGAAPSISSGRSAPLA
jgi:hypothetical protein